MSLLVPSNSKNDKIKEVPFISNIDKLIKTLEEVDLGLGAIALLKFISSKYNESVELDEEFSKLYNELINFIKKTGIPIEEYFLKGEADKLHKEIIEIKSRMDELLQDSHISDCYRIYNNPKARNKVPEETKTSVKDGLKEYFELEQKYADKKAVYQEMKDGTYGKKGKENTYQIGEGKHESSKKYNYSEKTFNKNGYTVNTSPISKMNSKVQLDHQANASKLSSMNGKVVIDGDNKGSISAINGKVSLANNFGDVESINGKVIIEGDNYGFAKTENGKIEVEGINGINGRLQTINGSVYLRSNFGLIEGSSVFIEDIGLEIERKGNGGSINIGNNMIIINGQVISGGGSFSGVNGKLEYEIKSKGQIIGTYKIEGGKDVEVNPIDDQKITLSDKGVYIKFIGNIGEGFYPSKK